MLVTLIEKGLLSRLEAQAQLRELLDDLYAELK